MDVVEEEEEAATEEEKEVMWIVETSSVGIVTNMVTMNLNAKRRNLI